MFNKNRKIENKKIKKMFNKNKKCLIKIEFNKCLIKIEN
jgi:hypothetical protein